MFDQVLISIKKNYFTLISIVLLFVYIIFFIAFLQFPIPVTPGIDPSWQYGITKAAEDNLIFGKDIVFTYGPWGYLIHGIFLENNFWIMLFFWWSTQLSFFSIIFIRIVTLKNKIKKILIWLGVISSIYIIKINSWAGLLADYQILFIFLTIFTFDKLWNDHLKLMSCLLAIIGGFSLLTKFTLGIYTLGFLVIYLLVNLYQAISVKSHQKIIDILLSFFYSIICYISMAWLALFPSEFTISLTKLLINIIISLLIMSIILYFLKKFKIIDTNIKIAKKPILIDLIKDKNLVSQIVFFIIYSLLITYTILFYSSASLIDFIYNSWQISSGYSSAMSFVGDTTELIIAILIFFIMLGILFFLVKNGYLNLSLGFLFITFIAFKHGFVRPDAHVLIYYQVILFIIPLCLSKINRIRDWKISFFCYLCTIVISLASFQHYADLEHSISTRLINSLHTISNFREMKSHNKNSADELLSIIRLPEDINNILQDKNVDIIPWDLSLAPANDLNWQPRPIFQSYSAYTSHLDNLNYQNYVSNPRDYLLYAFYSHSKYGKYPFFDEPKTFSFVYCNYAPIKVIEGDYGPVIKPIILLEKLSSSRCSTTTIDNKIFTKWNQVESIKNHTQSIIQAQVKIKYTLWGKIYKTIFRAPPVYIKIQYNNNTEEFYRIIPENANNGIIISHLPRNDQELLSFLSGDKKTEIKSFSFLNQNNSLYKQNIEVQLLSFNLEQKNDHYH